LILLSLNANIFLKIKIAVAGKENVLLVKVVHKILLVITVKLKNGICGMSKNVQVIKINIKRKKQ